MGYGISHEIRAANNGGGGATIATDPDPNATEPPETRIFRGRGRSTDAADFGIYAYALPVEFGLSIRLWMRDRQLRRWFAIGAAVVCAADVITTLSPGTPSIPAGAELFAQVTANAAGCALVGIGFFEDG